MPASKHGDQVVAALERFLKEHGGSVSSSHVGAFHQKHQKLMKPISNLKIFCEKRPEHFTIVDHGRGPWTLMLAQSIEEAANALQRFIAARGGSIRSSQLHEFRERYPSLAKVIYSKGTLQQFCQQHATFIVEESATMPGCTIRLSSAQPNLAQRLSQVAGSEGEGSIIADLASFVRENGGTASSEQFGSFYSR